MITFTHLEVPKLAIVNFWMGAKLSRFFEDFVGYFLIPFNVKLQLQTWAKQPFVEL